MFAGHHQHRIPSDGKKLFHAHHCPRRPGRGASIVGTLDAVAVLAGPHLGSRARHLDLAGSSMGDPAWLDNDGRGGGADRIHRSSHRGTADHIAVAGAREAAILLRWVRPACQPKGNVFWLV
jgi:hypothetical protein